MILYRHSQFGWVVISVIIAALAFTIFTTRLTEAGINWTILPYLFLFVVALLFYRIETTVTDSEVRVKLGIGLIRKVVRLKDIETTKPLQRQMILGWGIRIGAGFTLWNVSGFSAVEIKFKDKNWRFRIGTDQPEQLDLAIQRAVKAQSSLEMKD